MLWIGITGSIGTGKTTFSDILRQKNQMVLDADELAKAVLEHNSSGYKKALAAFGPEILQANGHIDRAALAKVVFSEKSKLETLENIVHPEIRDSVEKVKTLEKKNNRKFLFYDVPLLFEKQMEKSFDLVAMVTCDAETQIKRIKARNKWSDEEIRNRLAAQIPLHQKETKAHIVIDNNGSLEQLKIEAQKFMEWLETIT